MEEHKAFIGGKEIKEFYVGNRELDEIWCGNVLFWQKKTVKDYFEFTYSGATSFSAAGSISISVDDVEKWSGDYAQRTSFSLPSGGTNVKIRGNLTDISFYESSVTSVLTPFPESMGLKTSFYELFRRCYLLNYIPGDLFVNCTEVTNFSECFAGSDIRSIPDGLFSNCPKVTNFVGCFGSCKVLNYIPGDLFVNCTEVTNFLACFDDCRYALRSIPDGLFSNCPKVTNFVSCFNGCEVLNYIPGDLFVNCTEVTDFSACFMYCDSLSSIPDGLFSNCPNVTDFKNCFHHCDGLRSIPENIFSNCLKVTNFESCFGNCGRYLGDSIMTGRAPELWITHPNANGERCFSNTWGFENDKDIPSSWK